MADLSNLGDLVISVGGDISPLEAAFNQIPAAAEEAFGGVQSAAQAIDWSDLTTGTDQVAQSMGELAAAAQPASEAVVATAAAAGEAAPALQEVSDSAKEAGVSLSELVKTGLEIAGITLSIEALKEVLVGSTEAFGEFQRAGESLALITKDAAGAADAMERIPALADRLGQSIVPMEQAQQRFALFGVSLERIPDLLAAVADASVTAGQSFDTVANSFERMDNTGKLAVRTLQQTGLSFNDIAVAMNMAGASQAEVIKAFAALGEGAEGAAARAEVLIAATQRMPGAAEKTAGDVEGSWNRVSNATHEAMVSLGQAFGGFSGLATILVATIKGAETVVLFLANVVLTASDLFMSGVVQIETALKGLVATMGAIATGDFKGAWQAIKDTIQSIGDQTTATMDQVATDWTTGGQKIDKIWATTADDVTASSDKARTAINGFSAALTAAEKAFNTVAAAYAAGTATASQYETALKALDKAQMEAANGIQNAHTALLIVEDDYRKLAVAVTNAATNVAVIAAAVDVGQASWTQYVAALDALNKAQEAASGGLQNIGTVLDLVAVEFEKLAITAANAETNFQAVVADMAKGQANAIQYTNALNAMVKAHEQLAGGLQALGDAYAQVVDKQSQLNVAAANAATQLAAATQAYSDHKIGIDLVTAALQNEAAARAKALGGLLDQKAAMDAVIVAHDKLAEAATNAATMASAAYAAYDKGNITYKELTEYLTKAKQAEDALTGTHTQAAAGVQQLNVAHQALNSTLGASATAFGGATVGVSQFASSLNIVNGQMVNLGTQSAATMQVTNGFATSLQVVNGQLVTLGGQSINATTSTTDLASALQIVNGQLVNMGANTSTAAAGLSNIATAASNAASMVSELDTAMGDVAGKSLGQSLDATMNAKLGSMSVGLQPGDIFTNRTASMFPVGALWSSLFGGNPFPGTAPPGTDFTTFDPLQAGKNIQAAITANQQALASHTTALTVATQAVNSTTVAHTALVSSANLATSALASTAAAAAIAANATTAASGAAMVAAGVFGAAAQVVANTVQAATGGVISASQLTSRTPVVAPVSGGGVGSSLIMQQQPWLYGAGSLVPGPSIVNLNVQAPNSVITSQQAMQQLSSTVAATLVQQLSQLGIRLTRP